MARKKITHATLKRRALRIDQDPGHPLFLFTLSGEELLKVADISRIGRDEAGKLIGYQRAGVRQHIQAIVDYLNQGPVLFPNSIILALSSRVRFQQSRGPQMQELDPYAKAGVIEIPVPPNGIQKPAWIVDGQQRALALSKCDRPGLPIPISAFVADEIETQRDQFLRVNSTKPLPRGLITELLPEVSTVLPAGLATRKIPAAICDWLNQESSSPFAGLIRRPSTPAREKGTAVIADNSIIKMIKESLQQPSGCLFPYRNIATGETDFDGITALLIAYWSAVAKVFPDAWGKDSSASRLMHGAGIRSMGRLMDRIMPMVQVSRSSAVSQVIQELRLIAPICHWTSGRWRELDDMLWSDIQNVPRHINVLSNVLIRAYLQAKGLGRT